MMRLVALTPVGLLRLMPHRRDLWHWVFGGPIRDIHTRQGKRVKGVGAGDTTAQTLRDAERTHCVIVSRTQPPDQVIAPCTPVTLAKTIKNNAI